MDSYKQDLLPSNIVIESAEKYFNLEDEEMRSIIQQCMDIMKHEDFTVMIDELKIFLQEQHYQLDELVRKRISLCRLMRVKKVHKHQ